MLVQQPPWLQSLHKYMTLQTNNKNLASQARQGGWGIRIISLSSQSHSSAFSSSWEVRKTKRNPGFFVLICAISQDSQWKFLKISTHSLQHSQDFCSESATFVQFFAGFNSIFYQSLDSLSLIPHFTFNFVSVIENETLTYIHVSSCCIQSDLS